MKYNLSVGQDDDEAELNVIVFELSATLLRPVKIFGHWLNFAKFT